MMHSNPTMKKSMYNKRIMKDLALYLMHRTMGLKFVWKELGLIITVTVTVNTDVIEGKN